MDGFSIADALTNPDQIIEKYKSVAIKEGTRLFLLQAAFYTLLTWIVVDSVVKRRIKKVSQ
jgi:hypothetical protein